jgi:hypothetical protein
LQIGSVWLQALVVMEDPIHSKKEEQAGAAHVEKACAVATQIS